MCDSSEDGKNMPGAKPKTPKMKRTPKTQTYQDQAPKVRDIGKYQECGNARERK